MNRYRVTVNGREVDVTLNHRAGSLLNFSYEGQTFEIDVQPIIEKQVSFSQSAPSAPSVSAPRPTSPKTAVAGAVVAPMPGIVVSVAVKEGDQVTSGQTVVVMEAMKMENNIASSLAGIVKKVHVKKGQEVENGKILIEIG